MSITPSVEIYIKLNNVGLSVEETKIYQIVGRESIIC